jgi:pimeloyl-ACP methyl ester carboxylesterase
MDRAPKTRRRLKRILVFVLGLYLIVCLIMFSIQDWMIFPGRGTQGRAESVLLPSSDFQLLHLTTASGDPFVALFGLAINRATQPAVAGAPTILFFYGNAMCLYDTLDQFQEFRRLGANVMIVEYPGYGMSGGKASERSLYAAADAAFENLANRPEIDGKKIIAAGWSLGAAIAINVAAHHAVAGLATFSAFTSMPDMAHNLVPWLPTSLLLRSRFDNETKIKSIACPIFIAHGKHDSIVPFSMSRRLIAAAKGSVTNVEVDSDHNDIFENGGAELDQRFREFLSQLR